MNAAHSILPPSSAKAWVQCAMWPTMNKLYPQADTLETQGGRAAHSVFEGLLTDGVILAEGSLHPNGSVITQEMIEGAELLADTVRSRMPFEHFGNPRVEQRVAIPGVHPDCFGTPDVWAFSAKPLTLEVIDYKFGHRFVDEYENWQGICYIDGAIDAMAAKFGEPRGVFDQALQVNFTVVQPRCYYKGSPVRTWSFTGSDIRGHVNKLRAAALAALEPEPTATTNSECRDCPGRHACPALQLAAYSDAEFAVKSAPVELTPLAAALELRMLERSLERLEGRVQGLREALTAHLRSGESLPWYHLEQGYGRTQWTMPPDQVIAMGEIFGVKLAKLGVVTPSQAKKLGIDESVITAYSTTPLGQLKLVADNPADARRVFGTTN